MDFCKMVASVTHWHTSRGQTIPLCQQYITFPLVQQKHGERKNSINLYCYIESQYTWLYVSSITFVRFSEMGHLAFHSYSEEYICKLIYYRETCN